MKKCIIDGCEATKRIYSNGICELHNKRIARNGTPNTVIARKGASVREILKLHSSENALTGCVEWNGALDKYGHGIFTNKGLGSAHKVAWVEQNGPINKQTRISHICGNNKCVNVSHLEIIESKKLDKSQVTQDVLKSLLNYSSDTGVFTWAKKRSPNALQGSVAGAKSRGGYIRIAIGKKLYLAHRLAWLYCYGVWPNLFIDHIDGDGLNNAISNLRECSLAENNQNQRKAKTNSASGLLGVRYRTDTEKWSASLKIDGKYFHLGCFISSDAAYSAYLDAKRKHHAFCTI